MHNVSINAGVPFEIDLGSQGNTLNGTPFTYDVANLGNGRYHMLLNGKSITVEVLEQNHDEKTFQLRVNGKLATAGVKDQYDLLLKQLGIDVAATRKVSEIKAPMPGLVLRINVVPGQTVAPGEPLLVLEAMKMENVIKSPGEGVVKKIECTQGTAVEKGQVLVSFV